MSRDETGIEIIVEPDVVPRGTVDLRALDAPPGAQPPSRRVDATGAVVPAGITTRASYSPVVVPSPPGPAPADPAPVAAPTPGDEAPTGELQGLATESQAPELGSDSGDLSDLDKAVEAPIPPRPRSAEAAAFHDVAPAGGPVADEDEFASSVEGRFSPALTLVKVLVYLLTLTAVLVGLALHLVGVAPWQDSEPEQLASADPVEAELPAGAGSPDAPDAPPTPTESPAPSPAESPTPAESPSPAESPEPSPAESPAPTGRGEEEALATLRMLMAEAETGAEAGVEEEEPGILARIEQLRAEAVNAYQSGDLDGALAALEELLRLSPQDGDAVFRVGLVHHRRGDLGEAEGRYARAHELAPRDPRPLNNLSLIQLAQGARDDARETLKDALALAPEDPDVLTNLARLTADPEQARALYAKAVGVDPDHGPARLGRADVRQRLGDVDGARADLEHLAAAGGPLAARGHDGLGVLARRAGEVEAAVGRHRQALAADPDYAAARLNLGVALLDLGRDADAAEALEAAAEALPESARAWQALGVARIRLSEERPELLYEAKEAYERAIRLDGDDWVTHYNYALCAERFGNFLFAMREYERAISLEPEAWQAYANLGRLYHRGDETAKGLRYVERAIELAPEREDLHFQRAYLLAQQDRPIEARASLQRFVEQAAADDPRRGEALEGLGRDERPR